MVVDGECEEDTASEDGMSEVDEYTGSPVEMYSSLDYEHEAT